MVVNFDSILIGQQCWVDGKVVDADMGRIIDNFKPQPRGVLSMPNKADWPEDQNGLKKDPWVESRICLMKAPGKTGQVYTFTTGSDGGIKAFGELMQKMGEGIRDRGDGVFPVIALGAGGYNHRKHNTWVDVPAFKVVGWVPVSDFDVPLIARADEAGANFGEAETTESEPKATVKQTAAKKAGGSGARDITYDDE